MICGRFLTALSIAIVVPSPLAAQVAVTEIMYDLEIGPDSGREWIEIFAHETIDVTMIRIVESGTMHAIKAEGGSIIPKGSYGVIADNPEKFRSDHPSFAGFLFESSFSLNNKGESIAIVQSDGVPVDSITYTNVSGNGTGDSLQRNPGSYQFAAGSPTPGAPIPVNGLVPSMPTKKTSAKTKATPVSPPEKIEIVGKSDFPASKEAVLAAASAPQTPLLLWMVATSLLGLGSGIGLAYSRHLKKDEWDIIEEVEETG